MSERRTGGMTRRCLMANIAERQRASECSSFFYLFFFLLFLLHHLFIFVCVCVDINIIIVDVVVVVIVCRLDDIIMFRWFSPLLFLVLFLFCCNAIFFSLKSFHARMFFGEEQ